MNNGLRNSLFTAFKMFLRSIEVVAEELSCAKQGVKIKIDKNRVNVVFTLVIIFIIELK